MGQNNNTVGTNKAPEICEDDIHFDLAPTAGTDQPIAGGAMGTEYDLPALQAIAIARGMVYKKDGSAVATTDEITEVEVDLKPMGGEGIHEGDAANGLSVATTAQAHYMNNGSWTDIDPGGSRNDGEEVTTTLPTSVEKVFVANDSILVVHVTIKKIV